MTYTVPTQLEFDRMLIIHQDRMQDDEDSYPLKERLQFTCADISSLDLFGRDLQGVLFNRCVFSGDLSVVNFSGSAVLNCCFHDAILQGCNFESTILTDTSFRNCDLTNANFTRVRGGRQCFTDCDLTGARCEFGNFKSANFDNCNLTKVDMHHSDLRKAIFESCEVAGLCLCAADLRKAEFHKTNLLIVSDSMPWSNIIITAESMCIGDRCGTHEEWFSESIEEVESYQDPMGFRIYCYDDWGRWAPALKLMCEQVRIGLFNTNTVVIEEHAGTVT